jgi:hypothetical protein
MRRIMTGLLGAALVFGGATGCHDFLTKEDVVQDPNNPTKATRDQLLIAAQAALFGLQESGIAQSVCMWMQQCAGTGGRFVEQRGTNYQRLTSDYNNDFSQLYIGGGLVDLRKIQASATADGDKVYAGVAKVLEAFLIGFGADAWGNIPYSEAASDKGSPKFDNQLEVYAALQTLLTSAITDLDGAGSGPGAFDLVYGGDKAKWKQAAYTLKARYYMHTAEGPTKGTFVNAAYQNAITAANNGIASAANDFKAFHSAATSERNIWYQFLTASGFGQDLVAGARLVDLMKARNDPRLSAYFLPNEAGGYGGLDVNSATPANQVSPLNLEPEYRQPLITWAENQLILAEAKFQTGGGAAAALPHVNAVRQAAGLAPLSAGQVTLQSIMEEKYVALFQNIEAWSDYRRTCFPALDPAGSATEIPGRVYYGQAEENANPNTPTVAQQDATNGGRNPNDPAACTP